MDIYDKPSTLLRLPDEILQSIFYLLPPLSTIAAGATCRALNTLSSEPLLWRFYCHTIWDYWQDTKLLQAQKAAPAAETAWKAKFVNRFARDAHNTVVFEKLLTTQLQRIHHIEDIASSGYDAKEMLLAFCHAPDSADDILARRYWAEATLGLVHRTEALKLWAKLDSSDSPTLESSLGAFDLFVIGTRPGDLHDIETTLDDITHALRSAHPDFDELSLVQQAETIAAYLRSSGIIGTQIEDEYHAMYNNYMSFALLSEPHTSLPLQAVAIFCAVAKRLGITATTCNFPIHIYAMISVPGPRGNTFIYMDPWRQDAQVDRDQLETLLRQLGIPDVAHGQYLAPAFARDMVLRTGRNIMRSWEEHRRGAIAINVDAPQIDNESAFYGFLWSVLLISGEDDREVSIHRRRSYLPYLLDLFQTNFPQDIGLVERHISQMFWGHPHMGSFIEITTSLRRSDADAKPIIRRDELAARVKYKVGETFQHARYAYVGVIIGWDPMCQAGEQWMQQMAVDSLQQGRNQTFYHILGEDKSKRYVAEENIVRIFTPPSEAMLRLAGRYFKRWDDEQKVFVSNIRDEYPDD